MPGQVVREFRSGCLKVVVRRTKTTPPTFTLAVGYQRGRRFESQIPAMSGYVQPLSRLIEQAQVAAESEAWNAIQTKTSSSKRKVATK